MEWLGIGLLGCAGVALLAIFLGVVVVMTIKRKVGSAARSALGGAGSLGHGLAGGAATTHRGRAQGVCAAASSRALDV